LHGDDGLPALATQERRVRKHARDDLNEDADGVLAGGQDVDVVDGEVLGFKPEGEGRLLSWKARLHETISQREQPELPLTHEAEQLFAIPRCSAKWFEAYIEEALAGKFPLRWLEVKGAGVLWEVGVEEESEDSYWKTYDAANDEEPLPAAVAELSAEIFVRRCLEVAAEHAS